jgi:hypothetical protein
MINIIELIKVILQNRKYSFQITQNEELPTYQRFKEKIIHYYHFTKKKT